MQDYERHSKEKNPLDTVQYLIKILYDLGLKVSEKWMEDPLSGTSSLRLNVLNTSVGTNGKGISREYARASAYGEFFERLQNDVLFQYTSGEQRKLIDKFGFCFAPDEKRISVADMLKQNNRYLSMILSDLGGDGLSFEKKVKLFTELYGEELDKDGTILCLPFYDTLTDGIVYLPIKLVLSNYGSNGMAAGNTPEEAIVQGISEIIERAVQKRIHKEKPCFPEIPLEALERYPYLDERYRKLRSIPGYMIRLLDCSFNGKYPVAGLLVTEKNTGMFGLKLGCHPNYMFAIERAITEAAQGHSLLHYANRSIFDFANRIVEDETNIINGYKYGRAQYPYQLFGSEPDYNYYDFEASGKTNEMYLQEWVRKFAADGLHIIIRDVGFLGFPSYYILIPGLSEVEHHDAMARRAKGTLHYVCELFRKTDMIEEADIEYLTAVLSYYSNDIYRNRLKDLLGISQLSGIHMPYEEAGCDLAYLNVICMVRIKRYDRAHRIMAMIRRAVEGRNVPRQFVVQTDAVLMYLSGMKEIQDHKKVMRYIEQFYDEEIVENIDDLFCDYQKVFEKQYHFLEECMRSKEHSGTFDIVMRIKLIQQQNIIDQLGLQRVLKTF